MKSGNGIDLAAVYQLLTEVAQRVGAIEGRLDSHDRRFDRIDACLADHTQKLNQLVITVNDHTRKLDGLAVIVSEHGRKIDDLTAGLGELRLTVYDYHNSVVTQGILAGEFDERLKRLERQLNADPPH
jgi:hypothetical protein